MMSDLSTFISTLGFPIVVAIAMFYQNNALSSSYQQMTKELQSKIEANTLIMQRLIDKLDQDDLLNNSSVKGGSDNANTNNK